MAGRLLTQLMTVLVLIALLAPCAWAATAETGAAPPVKKVRADKNPRPVGWIAPDQAEARAVAKTEYPYVTDVLMEDLPLRKQRLRNQGISIKDMTHSYFLLDSPYVNTYEDKYGPVRFMHSKHAAALQGECATCHHYRPADANAGEIMACRGCHQDAFTQKDKNRVGLKAAYHMQCVDCHEEMKKGPVSCEGCHTKKSVDHEQLVKLPQDPTPQEVTAECLRCHEQAGKDMLQTAHWLWRGPSPFTTEHRKSVMSGKGTTTLNNF